MYSVPLWSRTFVKPSPSGPFRRVRWCTAGRDCLVEQPAVALRELSAYVQECTSMNVTVEQFALALAYFCVEPGAKEALEQWYTTMQSKDY